MEQVIDDWFKDKENKWVHVAIAEKDGVRRIYIDGSLFGTSNDGERGSRVGR